MRMTNQQKWDKAQLVLDAQKSAYIDLYFEGEEKPTAVFRAETNKIVKIDIGKITVWCSKEPRCFKKPSNNDLLLLYEFIADFSKADKEIMLHYIEICPTYTCRGAFRMSEIKNNERLSFVREALIPVQKELFEKYAPREGYKPCAYCGKQVPENTLVPYKIIFQDSRPSLTEKSGWHKFVNEKTNMYCSKARGAYDQMAHGG